MIKERFGERVSQTYEWKETKLKEEKDRRLQI